MFKQIGALTFCGQSSILPNEIWKVCSIACECKYLLVWLKKKYLKVDINLFYSTENSSENLKLISNVLENMESKIPSLHEDKVECYGCCRNWVWFIF